MKKRPNESWDEFRKRFVIAKLRNVSLHWPARTEALKAARRARGLYECYVCHDLFRKGEYQLDHIIPVVSVTKGHTNMEDYITRLLPIPEKWGVICIKDHEAKTAVENLTRDAIRAEKRKLDKKIKQDAKKLAKKK